MIARPMKDRAIHDIHVDAKAAIERDIAEQGGTKETVLEVRHLERLDAILDSISVEEAEARAARIIDSVFIRCLFLRGKGKIFPKTPEEYHKKADKAEALAAMLWTQYSDLKPLDEDDLKKRMKLLQRHQDRLAHAANLRSYAQRLKEDPTLQPFEVEYPKTPKDEEEKEDEVKETKPKKARKPRRPKATRRRKSA